MTASKRSALRMLAIAVSTLTMLGVIFAVMFIQAREDSDAHKRQLNYGELDRMQHQLRDWIDVLRQRVLQNSGELKAENRLPGARDIEDYPAPLMGLAGAQASKVPGWCATAANTIPKGESATLAFEGKQRRDNRVMLTSRIVDGRLRYTCSRIDVIPKLGSADGKFSPSDVAVSKNGRILLVLRGDASWPDSISLAIAKPSASGKSATPAVVAPQIAPVEVSVGGDRRDLYAVPLDMGRQPISIDGTVCLPRECMLLALGHQTTLAESFNDLSPVARTTFLTIGALLLLLIPLLKLKTIDENGSLHWLDVAALAASVPLAIASVTILLAVQGHWMVQRLALDQTAMLEAVQLAEDLDEEVVASIRETYLQGCRQVGIAIGKDGGATECSLKSPNSKVTQTLPMSIAQWRSVADGKPWYSQNHISDLKPATDITDRTYFSKVSKGEGLLAVKGLPQTDHLSDWSFAAAQVPTTTDGTSRLIIALTRKDDNVPCPATGGATALGQVGYRGCFLLGAKELASTLLRPLPAGFGYAVIDGETLEVLQHSDPTQMHSQHFDEQISQVSRLKSFQRSINTRCEREAARGGEKPNLVTPLAPVASLYRGDRARITLTVACVPRWIVATWYDSAYAQNGVVLPARLAGSLIALFAIAGALIALAATSMCGSDKLIGFIWPRPDALGSGSDEELSKRATQANAKLQSGLPWLALYLGAGFLFRGDFALLNTFGAISITMIAYYFAYYASTAQMPSRRIVWFAILLVAIACGLLAWRGDLEFSLFMLYLSVGGWLAWTIGGNSPAGTGPSVASASGNSGSKPLLHPVQTVAERTQAVRRVQFWGMVLIAVIPSLFAYKAGSDAVAAAVRSGDQISSVLARREALAFVRRAYCEMYKPQGKDLPPVSCLSSAVDKVGTTLDMVETESASLEKTLLGSLRPADKDHLQRFWPFATIELGTPPWRLDTRLVTFFLQEIVTPTQFQFVQAIHDAGGEAQTDGRGEQHSELAPLALKAVSKRYASQFQYEQHLYLSSTVVVVMIAAGLLALGTILVLLRTINHGLFGLQHFEFRSLHPRRQALELALAINPPPKILFIDCPWSEYKELLEGLKPGEGYELLNLGQMRGDFAARAPSTLAQRPWVVRGFESIIANRELRLAALDFLERLVLRDEVKIYFFSEMSPLARLKHQREREKDERREAGLQARNYESEAFRWADLFEDFVTFRFENDRSTANAIVGAQADQQRRLDAWRTETGDQATAIEAELRWIPSERVKGQLITFTDLSKRDLEEIKRTSGKQIVSRIGRKRPSPTQEQILEYLANFLGDYYQSQWVRSSKEEHLVMHHLAHGRFVNADNFSVINNLLTRGLLRRDPHFRLMNESFAYWIRTLEHPRWFERFRQNVERGGAWNALRIPILMLAASAALFIAYLDQGMSGSVITLIPAIAATIPLLIGRISQTRQDLNF